VSVEWVGVIAGMGFRPSLCRWIALVALVGCFSCSVPFCCVRVLVRKNEEKLYIAFLSVICQIICRFYIILFIDLYF
jgi:hypothetical protein